MKNFFISIFLLTGLLASLSSKGQAIFQTKKAKSWADSVLLDMSIDEKIGQLFMVSAYSNLGEAHTSEVLDQIKKYHVGGLIFFQGGPVRQAHLTNLYQSKSELPLMIGMDAEWGLSMRLDSTYAFPWNMTLGAIKNNDLVEKVGRQVGEHCKRLGVHFNFAPVVDINTNPKNPIIGVRSFGEQKEVVASHSLAFMEGMQSSGVMANAKHFPGHGDTDSDSHKTLPTISFSNARIDSLELYPYKSLFSKGLSSVMVAHLNVPSLDDRLNYPSSLSYPIVTDLLQKKLGFDGLIFTDALDMKGVSNFSDPGEVDLQAFLAGNDVMLMSLDVSQGISTLLKAVKSGVISKKRLARSVKKILDAKYKVGLANYKPTASNNLLADLNRQKDNVLYQSLMENAITLVQNKNNLLPLKNLDLCKIAYVNMGTADASPFVKTLKKYKGKLIEVTFDKNISSTEIKNKIIKFGITSNNRVSRLKRLMNAKGIVRILESHNSLTGLIIESILEKCIVHNLYIPLYLELIQEVAML